MQSKQVPLFMVGGINHPVSHISMAGMVSAVSGTPSTDSKALLVSDTSSTVSGVNVDFAFRPGTPSPTDPDIYGTYAGDAGDKLPLIPAMPTPEYNQLESEDKKSDYSYTWFDPGFRGGGGDNTYGLMLSLIHI